MKVLKLSFTLVLIGSLSACTSMSANPGATTALGSAVGAGIGAGLGDDVPKSAAFGGIIGAGAGYGVSLLAENADNTNEDDYVVIRKPLYDTQTQREIDDLHSDVHNSTKWGKGEVREWDYRYVGEDSSTPYQGASH